MHDEFLSSKYGLTRSHTTIATVVIDLHHPVREISGNWAAKVTCVVALLAVLAML